MSGAGQLWVNQRKAWVGFGLGHIVALYHRSRTFYQICSEDWCLCF
jgi:hypothetical protein